MAIFTIGHSTHSKEAFLELLGEVPMVADVRSHPASKWEQFRFEELKKWLPDAGKWYTWLPDLGGWTAEDLPLAGEMAEHGVDVQVYASGKFPKQRIAQTLSLENGPAWTNVGLRDYAAFMSTERFLKGVDRLIQLGEETDVAMMCAEAVPWRCHRMMVSDYLLWRGIDSTHIMRPGNAPSARKLHSSMVGNRLERYEPWIVDRWAAVNP